MCPNVTLQCDTPVIRPHLIINAAITEKGVAPPNRKFDPWSRLAVFPWVPGGRPGIGTLPDALRE